MAALTVVAVLFSMTGFAVFVVMLTTCIIVALVRRKKRREEMRRFEERTKMDPFLFREDDYDMYT